MSRPSKAVTQVKKVAPPAVPDVFRHSGSSFGSAGYASSEDGCFLSSGTGGGGGDDGSYGMPSGKSPGPIFTHPGFAFPPIVGKYAHAEDQGTHYKHLLLEICMRSTRILSLRNWFLVSLRHSEPHDQFLNLFKAQGINSFSAYGSIHIRLTVDVADLNEIIFFRFFTNNK